MYHEQVLRDGPKASDGTVRATICAGRFTGPTIEHEKLFNRVMEIDDDFKFIFVFGPNRDEKLTKKDPLLLSEKRVIMQRVLPPEVFEHVVFGDHQYTSSLFQALVNVYFHTKRDGYQIELNVVGGDGELGLDGTSEGASANEYSDILARANHSTYPTGTTRMAFDKVNFIRQPRGDISGTKVRQAASTYNYKSEEDVEQFKTMLHSGYSSSLARGLMKIIQERTNGNHKPT